MQRLLTLLRGLGSVFAGYLVMAGLITLVQEVLFDGVTWDGSTTGVLAVAGAGTFLAAVVGGALAARLAGSDPLLHAWGMALIVITETAWLLDAGRLAGPLWFDIAAAVSLIVGILLGAAWMGARRQEQARLRELVEGAGG